MIADGFFAEDASSGIASTVLPSAGQTFGQSVPQAVEYRQLAPAAAELWWEDVESVVEIGPEFPFVDHTPQILIGRGNDAHIDLKDRPPPAARIALRTYRGRSSV